jgi:hypothetical protein
VTNPLSSEEIIVLLHQAMTAATDLSQDDAENIEELVQVGELLVAYETLCTQLHEYDILLSASMIEDLRIVGQSLGAASMYAEVLLENVADGT